MRRSMHCIAAVPDTAPSTMFTLDPQHPTPPVQQIVDRFRDLIRSGALRPGAEAPLIRQFAHAHGVSAYTVVDACDG